MKKFLPVFLAAATALLLSCGGNQNTAGAAVDGKAIFESNCALCHGASGNAMLAGASDLTVCTLDTVGIRQVVANGRNTMAAFSGRLTDIEIDAVVQYVLSLRKK